MVMMMMMMMMMNPDEVDDDDEGDDDDDEMIMIIAVFVVLCGSRYIGRERIPYLMFTLNLTGRERERVNLLVVKFDGEFESERERKRTCWWSH